MFSIVWCALLWLYLAEAAEVFPAAVDIDPSQYWDGDDGPWSSFPVRVGTPAQDLRVFVSTAATSTWVVQAPLGCEGYTGPDCANARGGNFTNSTSSTWENKGVFDLYVEQNLGYNDVGDYGFDTVGLGYQGTGVSVNNSLVALITTPDWAIGELGLNPRPTNFTNFDDPVPSLLTVLYEQSMIPSLSYSYTAGAQYRLNGVLGSLTLGGYDDSLYEPNSISFGFYSDQTRDLTVGLQAITSQTASGNTSLLPTPGLFLIDSTVSQIYLPEDACQEFENAFGLMLDSSGYYLVNDTQHEALLASNPNITFTLGQEATGGETFSITFPYAAFDKNLSYPIQKKTTRYFPIIPATNSTQYTFGRAFLQEAYLTVDYQRSNFSVSQRTWSLDAKSNIVSIRPPSNSTTSPTPGTSPNTNKNSRVSGGAIAGIVIGVIAALTIIGGLIFLRNHKKRKIEERQAALVAQAVSDMPKEPDASELASPYIKRPELHGQHSFTRAEIDSSHVVSYSELDGETVRYELEAPHGMHEMSTPRMSDASLSTEESISPIGHLSDVG